MKSRFCNFLFITVFLAVCLIPAVGMLVFGESEALANEILTQRPALVEADGTINEEFTQECTDYMADRFAGRPAFITAYAKLQAALFRESASEKVILGREGWLFYANTMDDYLHRNTLSRREINGICRTLELMQEYAGSQGAECVFLVAPNKNSLSSNADYMPSVGEPLKEEKNLDKLEAALEGRAVEYVPLRDLLDQKGLYHRLDSHWNRLGAGKAFDSVMEKLGRPCIDWSREGYRTVQNHRGDLYEMLYPVGKELDDNVVFDRPFRFQYIDVTDTRPFVSLPEGIAGYEEEGAPPADRQLLETVCSEGEGTLFMFRDSFGNALHPFFADAFERAAFSRQMPWRLDWLTDQEVDVLALEIVERNLPDLARKAPVMPARRVEESDQEEDQPGLRREVQLSWEESSEMEGYIKLWGTYETKDGDEDIRVYIDTGSELFEACPVGEANEEVGQGGFTAYLPEADWADGELQVILQEKGGIE